MKKVLFLINKFTIGGAETVVLNEINLLDKELFDPYLGVLYKTVKSENLFDRLDIPKEKVAVFAFRRLWDVFALWRLYRFIKRERFDVVFTNLFEANFAGRIAAKMAGVPAIFAAEHSFYAGKSRWQILADNVLAKISKKIVAVSEAVADFAGKQAAIPKKHFCVIKQISDVSLRGLYNREMLRIKFNIPAEAFVCVTVGRFSPEKAQKRVIEIADILVNERKEKGIYFVLVGYGREEEELRALGRQKKLDEYVKIVNDPKNAKEYNIMGEIFLLPSRREGVPLSLLEAMNAGLVPVVSDIGGLKEVVGEAGYVFGEDDIRGMADKIKALFSDKNLYESLSLKATREVSRSLGDIKELEDLFLNK